MRYFKREENNVLQQLWAIKETPEYNESQSWNINYYKPKMVLPLSWNELVEIRSDEFFRLAQEYQVLTPKDTVEPKMPTSADQNP